MNANGIGGNGRGLGGAGFLELDQGVDAAVIDAVVDLVAVEEPDAGRVGEFVHGIEEILVVVAGRCGVSEFGIEEDSLQSGGPPLAPAGGDLCLDVE
jgi:hypothetical protein